MPQLYIDKYPCFLLDSNPCLMVQHDSRTRSRNRSNTGYKFTAMTTRRGWYWARTRDKPATIRYPYHSATAATKDSWTAAHDGALAHFCVPVRDWLAIAHTSRWITRQGPVIWPQRSPDLTPMNFFLWGHLKELVYRDVVTTQMDLVARLHAACTLVDPAVLRHRITAIPWHAQACLDMHGRHFEHLP
ncbi:uncharacterized protein TNCV_1176741 [Trichonephila clavipes]|nr:uncharacterized protein TNCV_1176741 [Trichonephila clavipes]